MAGLLEASIKAADVEKLTALAATKSGLVTIFALLEQPGLPPHVAEAQAVALLNDAAGPKYGSSCMFILGGNCELTLKKMLPV